MRRILLMLIVLFAGISSGRAQLTQTNLPILSLTSSLPVGDTQVAATLKIINNAPAMNHPADVPQFNGNIGLKLRGNTAYPKKSYTVETWTTFKNEIDTPLLGMPADNDWVLLAAYPDRSLLRSLLVYELYDHMGHYAPRMQLCELMVNGAYQGVYLFGETIKRDSNRISIKKLNNTDNSGDPLTGGYIFQVDKSSAAYWTSLYTPPFRSGQQTIQFHYEYPADNKITPVQKAYLKGYTDSFENALTGNNFQDTSLGWRGYAAHTNFEDFEIINELSGNEEAYRLHTYMYKDRLKKLRPASPWEADLSLYNTASCSGAQDTAWMYRHAQYCPADTLLPPFWWYRLQNDTDFVKAVKCRYTSLRGSLFDTAQVFHRIDSMATYLNAQGAIARNFALWNIWNTPIVNEPMPLAQNYAAEILRIKTYYKKRLLFLDSKWTSYNCAPLGIAAIAGILSDAILYPNPANETATLRFALLKESTLSLHLRNMLGQEVFGSSTACASGIHFIPLSLQSLPAGWYTVSLEAQGVKPVVLRIFKQ